MKLLAKLKERERGNRVDTTPTAGVARSPSSRLDGGGGVIGADSEFTHSDGRPSTSSTASRSETSEKDREPRMTTTTPADLSAASKTRGGERSGSRPPRRKDGATRTRLPPQRQAALVPAYSMYGKAALGTGSRGKVAQRAAQKAPKDSSSLAGVPAPVAPETAPSHVSRGSAADERLERCVTPGRKSSGKAQTSSQQPHQPSPKAEHKDTMEATEPPRPRHSRPHLSRRDKGGNPERNGDADADEGVCRERGGKATTDAKRELRRAVAGRSRALSNNAAPLSGAVGPVLPKTPIPEPCAAVAPCDPMDLRGALSEGSSPSFSGLIASQRKRVSLTGPDHPLLLEPAPTNEAKRLPSLLVNVPPSERGPPEAGVCAAIVAPLAISGEASSAVLSGRESSRGRGKGRSHAAAHGSLPGSFFPAATEPPVASPTSSFMELATTSSSLATTEQASASFGLRLSTSGAIAAASTVMPPPMWNEGASASAWPRQCNMPKQLTPIVTVLPTSTGAPTAMNASSSTITNPSTARHSCTGFSDAMNRSDPFVTNEDTSPLHRPLITAYRPISPGTTPMTSANGNAAAAAFNDPVSATVTSTDSVSGSSSAEGRAERGQTGLWPITPRADGDGGTAADATPLPLIFSTRLLPQLPSCHAHPDLLSSPQSFSSTSNPAPCIVNRKGRLTSLSSSGGGGMGYQPLPVPHPSSSHAQRGQLGSQQISGAADGSSVAMPMTPPLSTIPVACIANLDVASAPPSSLPAPPTLLSSLPRPLQRGSLNITNGSANGFTAPSIRQDVSLTWPSAVGVAAASGAEMIGEAPELPRKSEHMSPTTRIASGDDGENGAEEALPAPSAAETGTGASPPHLSRVPSGSESGFVSDKMSSARGSREGNPSLLFGSASSEGARLRCSNGGREGGDVAVTEALRQSSGAVPVLSAVEVVSAERAVGSARRFGQGRFAARDESVTMGDMEGTTMSKSDAASTPEVPTGRSAKNGVRASGQKGGNRGSSSTTGGPTSPQPPSFTSVPLSLSSSRLSCPITGVAAVAGTQLSPLPTLVGSCALTSCDDQSRNAAHLSQSPTASSGSRSTPSLPVTASAELLLTPYSLPAVLAGSPAAMLTVVESGNEAAAAAVAVVVVGPTAPSAIRNTPDALGKAGKPLERTPVPLEARRSYLATPVTSANADNVGLAVPAATSATSSPHENGVEASHEDDSGVESCSVTARPRPAREDQDANFVRASPIDRAPSRYLDEAAPAPPDGAAVGPSSTQSWSSTVTASVAAAEIPHQLLPLLALPSGGHMPSQPSQPSRRSEPAEGQTATAPCPAPLPPESSLRAPLGEKRGDIVTAQLSASSSPLIDSDDREGEERDRPTGEASPSSRVESTSVHPDPDGNEARAGSRCDALARERAPKKALQALQPPTSTALSVPSPPPLLARRGGLSGGTGTAPPLRHPVNGASRSPSAPRNRSGSDSAPAGTDHDNGISISTPPSAVAISASHPQKDRSRASRGFTFPDTHRGDVLATVLSSQCGPTDFSLSEVGQSMHTHRFGPSSPLTLPPFNSLPLTNSFAGTQASLISATAKDGVVGAYALSQSSSSTGVEIGKGAPEQTSSPVAIASTTPQDRELAIIIPAITSKPTSRAAASLDLEATGAQRDGKGTPRGDRTDKASDRVSSAHTSPASIPTIEGTFAFPEFASNVSLPVHLPSALLSTEAEEKEHGRRDRRVRPQLGKLSAPIKPSLPSRQQIKRNGSIGSGSKSEDVMSERGGAPRGAPYAPSLARAPSTTEERRMAPTGASYSFMTVDASGLSSRNSSTCGLVDTEPKAPSRRCSRHFVSPVVWFSAQVCGSSGSRRSITTETSALINDDIVDSGSFVNGADSTLLLGNSRNNAAASSYRREFSATAVYAEAVPSAVASDVLLEPASLAESTAVELHGPENPLSRHEAALSEGFTDVVVAVRGVPSALLRAASDPSHMPPSSTTTSPLIQRANVSGSRKDDERDTGDGGHLLGMAKATAAAAKVRDAAHVDEWDLASQPSTDGVQAVTTVPGSRLPSRPISSTGSAAPPQSNVCSPCSGGTRASNVAASAETPTSDSLFTGEAGPVDGRSADHHKAPTALLERKLLQELDNSGATSFSFQPQPLTSTTLSPLPMEHGKTLSSGEVAQPCGRHGRHQGSRTESLVSSTRDGEGGLPKSLTMAQRLVTTLIRGARRSNRRVSRQISSVSPLSSTYSEGLCAATPCPDAVVHDGGGADTAFATAAVPVPDAPPLSRPSSIATNIENAECKDPFSSKVLHAKEPARIFTLPSRATKAGTDGDQHGTPVGSGLDRRTSLLRPSSAEATERNPSGVSSPPPSPSRTSTPASRSSLGNICCSTHASLGGRDRCSDGLHHGSASTGFREALQNRISAAFGRHHSFLTDGDASDGKGAAQLLHPFLHQQHGAKGGEAAAVGTAGSADSAAVPSTSRCGEMEEEKTASLSGGQANDRHLPFAMSDGCTSNVAGVPAASARLSCWSPTQPCGAAAPRMHSLPQPPQLVTSTTPTTSSFNSVLRTGERPCSSQQRYPRGPGEAPQTVVGGRPSHPVMKSTAPTTCSGSSGNRDGGSTPATVSPIHGSSGKVAQGVFRTSLQTTETTGGPLIPTGPLWSITSAAQMMFTAASQLTALPVPLSTLMPQYPEQVFTKTRASTPQASDATAALVQGERHEATSRGTSGGGVTDATQNQSGRPNVVPLSQRTFISAISGGGGAASDVKNQLDSISPLSSPLSAAAAAAATGARAYSCPQAVRASPSAPRAGSDSSSGIGIQRCSPALHTMPVAPASLGESIPPPIVAKLSPKASLSSRCVGQRTAFASSLRMRSSPTKHTELSRDLMAGGNVDGASQGTLPLRPGRWRDYSGRMAGTQGRRDSVERGRLQPHQVVTECSSGFPVHALHAAPQAPPRHPTSLGNFSWPLGIPCGPTPDECGAPALPPRPCDPPVNTTQHKLVTLPSGMVSSLACMGALPLHDAAAGVSAQATPEGSAREVRAMPTLPSPPRIPSVNRGAATAAVVPTALTTFISTTPSRCSSASNYTASTPYSVSVMDWSVLSRGAVRGASAHTPIASNAGRGGTLIGADVPLPLDPVASGCISAQRSTSPPPSHSHHCAGSHDTLEVLTHPSVAELPISRPVAATTQSVAAQDRGAVCEEAAQVSSQLTPADPVANGGTSAVTMQWSGQPAALRLDGAASTTSGGLPNPLLSGDAASALFNLSIPEMSRQQPSATLPSIDVPFFKLNDSTGEDGHNHPINREDKEVGPTVHDGVSPNGLSWDEVDRRVPGTSLPSNGEADGKTGLDDVANPQIRHDSLDVGSVTMAAASTATAAAMKGALRNSPVQPFSSSYPPNSGGAATAILPPPAASILDLPSTLMLGTAVKGVYRGLSGSEIGLYRMGDVFPVASRHSLDSASSSTAEATTQLSGFELDNVLSPSPRTSRSSSGRSGSLMGNGAGGLSAHASSEFPSGTLASLLYVPPELRRGQQWRHLKQQLANPARLSLSSQNFTPPSPSLAVDATHRPSLSVEPPASSSASSVARTASGLEVAEHRKSASPSSPPLAQERGCSPHNAPLWRSGDGLGKGSGSHLISRASQVNRSDKMLPYQALGTRVQGSDASEFSLMSSTGAAMGARLGLSPREGDIAIGAVNTTANAGTISGNPTSNHAGAPSALTGAARDATLSRLRILVTSLTRRANDVHPCGDEASPSHATDPTAAAGEERYVEEGGEHDAEEVAATHLKQQALALLEATSPFSSGVSVVFDGSTAPATSSTPQRLLTAESSLIEDGEVTDVEASVAAAVAAARSNHSGGTSSLSAELAVLSFLGPQAEPSGFAAPTALAMGSIDRGRLPPSGPESGTTGMSERHAGAVEVRGQTPSSDGGLSLPFTAQTSLDAPAVGAAPHSASVKPLPASNSPLKASLRKGGSTRRVSRSLVTPMKIAVPMHIGQLHPEAIAPAGPATAGVTGDSTSVALHLTSPLRPDGTPPKCCRFRHYTTPPTLVPKLLTVPTSQSPSRTGVGHSHSPQRDVDSKALETVTIITTISTNTHHEQDRVKSPSSETWKQRGCDAVPSGTIPSQPKQATTATTATFATVRRQRSGAARELKGKHGGGSSGVIKFQQGGCVLASTPNPPTPPRAHTLSKRLSELKKATVPVMEVAVPAVLPQVPCSSLHDSHFDRPIHIAPNEDGRSASTKRVTGSAAVTPSLLQHRNDEASVVLPCAATAAATLSVSRELEPVYPTETTTTTMSLTPTTLCPTHETPGSASNSATPLSSCDGSSGSPTAMDSHLPQVMPVGGVPIVDAVTTTTTTSAPCTGGESGSGEGPSLYHVLLKGHPLSIPFDLLNCTMVSSVDLASPSRSFSTATTPPMAATLRSLGNPTGKGGPRGAGQNPTAR